MAWRQAFGDSTCATLTKRNVDIGPQRAVQHRQRGSLPLRSRRSRACSHPAMNASSASGGTSNALMSLTT